MNKTPEQLKGTIKNIAKEKNLRAQEILQMFFFERIIERLAASPYQKNFILKGGLLISSMIGISERTTMDMDTTVQGVQMEEKEIVAVIKSILDTDVGDDVTFVYKRIEPIREEDAYNNFRVHLEAIFGKMKNPMKIDITTGDVITPAAIQYKFPLSFEERTVPVMAYTIETILAEKYETIIRRNIASTRARDFYDMYILYRVYKDKINIDFLREAVLLTAKKRESLDDIRDWKDILKDIREEPQLYIVWDRYLVDNSYIGNLEFHNTLDVIEEIAEKLNL